VDGRNKSGHDVEEHEFDEHIASMTLDALISLLAKLPGRRSFY